MAAPVLYRVLARTLREQSKSLVFSSTWPSKPGLKGFAAAGCVVDPAMLSTALEWEDFLYRSDELRAMPLEFLRPFFSPHADRPLYDLAWYRVETEYPALAALLMGSDDPIDRGFAALRQASQHSELLQKMDVHNPGPPAQKTRPPHLLFAIGDVLQHRFFGRCVVVGWDEVCPQPEEWVVANQIRENLEFGTEQPFYQVLLEDNEIPRCCSQENLALADDPSPSVFDHPHAALYFQGLQRARAFVPSPALAYVYPEDHAASSAARNYRSLADAVGAGPE
jgi:hemimethylated DNA binding protein